LAGKEREKSLVSNN